jgi:alpha-amylase/alpha-mannosidase (GH57 family)
MGRKLLTHGLQLEEHEHRLSMEQYICIHGHFYQPPRENAWLETVELQDSAYPYHDWNKRITAECYAPNSVARILDEQNRIVHLVNNYSKISFNFGPTLLQWLESQEPQVYEAILAADRQSMQNFSGHGSALAQPYNHTILPLANRRDRRTQVVWGIRDFELRFKRRPEGMWLPETAVDLETLEILADEGIRFTILAPHQAARVRRSGTRLWHDVSGDRIDPTRAYVQQLPSGKNIALFFYDGLIARAVAFEGLLTRGEQFAERLTGAFSDHRTWPQLVHIATDGESYGHHHRFGDMALAYALNHIESKKLARLTNYGEYLDRHPPKQQVDIIEKTSWSCFHGIDRWWRNCGCNTGGRADWNQEWRTPLRNALDWLRDWLTGPFEAKAREYFRDPFAARNDYINIIHSRTPAAIEDFFARHALNPLDPSARITALKLLELQRHALLMYTSCGWFFDDLSGIETVQIIQYAARVVQLSEQLFGESPEPHFVEKLAHAKSNVVGRGDGRHIYHDLVRSAMVDWERIGAHYAVRSLFDSYPDETAIYCYRAQREDYQVFTAGSARLAVGRVKLTSEIAQESSRVSFCVLHMGDHNVNGGVQEFMPDELYQNLLHELPDPFNRADFAEVIRMMDRYFGESNYSLRSLFREEQRTVLDSILGSALFQSEALYRQIYEQRAPVMRYLTDLSIPLPGAFTAAAEFVLNSDLRRALQDEEINPARVTALLDAAKIAGVPLDTATLEFAFRKNVERLADGVAEAPSEANLGQLDKTTDLLRILPFPVNLWRVQNIYYALLQSLYPKMQKRGAQGDQAAQEWLGYFEKLAQKLAIKLPS